MKQTKFYLVDGIDITITEVFVDSYTDHNVWIDGKKTSIFCLSKKKRTEYCHTYKNALCTMRKFNRYHFRNAIEQWKKVQPYREMVADADKQYEKALELESKIVALEKVNQ